MPAGADDRYFYNGDGESIGNLATKLDIRHSTELGLIDAWQGLDVHLEFNRSSDLWTFPIETVSQSEAGFELVHQSVCVMPHWLIRGDAEGKWSMQMDIRITNSHQPSVRGRQSREAIVIASNGSETANAANLDYQS
jgi:alpha-amylase